MPDDGGTARLWATWAKNFASALVAGGAGAVLTMVLGGQAIDVETYVALQVLFLLMLVGSVFSLHRSARRLDRNAPGWDLVKIVGLSLLACTGVSMYYNTLEGWTWPLAQHTIAWWCFGVEGLVVAAIGGSLRFVATELLLIAGTG